MPIIIKSPGGNLTWLTPILALGGPYLGYTFWQEGHPILAAVFASVGLCSLLVWFDHKWVAWPLMSFFAFIVIAGTVLMCLQGFELRRLLRLAVAAYTVYELWEW